MRKRKSILGNKLLNIMGKVSAVKNKICKKWFCTIYLKPYELKPVMAPSP